MKTEIANILREAADKIEAAIPAFEEMHAGDPLPELPADQGIPSFLLPFPPVPEGYKEWKFRGNGWKRDKGSPVAYKSAGNPNWNPVADYADGGEYLYYLEACKDESATALPDPPDGFHPAMMGPLKVLSVKDIDKDVAQYCRDKQWRIGAQGWDSTPYALRKGSEIAKLNGLEAEEPNQPSFRYFTQGASKYKVQTADPKGTLGNERCVNGEWQETIMNLNDMLSDWGSAGNPVEYFPETKPEPVTRREWLVSINRENGLPYPYDTKDDPENWEFATVREILPGDPTHEQVEELVRAASSIAPSDHEFNSGAISDLRKALAPFRKP